MTMKQRTATQIFRQAQEGQLLEHVALIQELEGKVAALEAELNAARRSGGTQELQQLPGAALETLVRVFDAVPIPDLSAWERRQSLARLTSILSELESSGELPAGTWSAEGPCLNVREGDGGAIARTTREVLRTLGEAAGKYLAQMVEFQGTTPDVVSRARAASLMDVSSLVDAKAQFGVLPPDGQRELFEDNVDELIKAKDQLATIASWMNQGRDLTQRVLERRGLTTGRGASLLGLLQTLADAGAGHEVPSASTVQELVSRYATLLPAKEILELMALESSEFQRTYAQAAVDGSPLAFLAEALAEVLADHVQVVDALKDTALKQRERQALSLLKKTQAGSPAKARKALLRVVAKLSAVEDAQAGLEAAQKAVAKRFAHALERHARATFDQSERPEAQAAAFERLDKAGKNAFLAGLWLEQVGELARLLNEEGGEGAPAQRARARAALLSAVGAEDRQLLASRRRALDVLSQTLRNPAEDSDAFDLTVTTPIDVEAGLFARQTADLGERVAAFLGSYSSAKKAGMQTLESAVTRLTEIDALKQGKKAALDKVLKGSRKGKHSPKKELAVASALLVEQRAIAEGLAQLESRKAAAVAQVGGELAPFGLRATLGYDALLRAITTQQEKIELAAAALAELDACQARAVEITQTLSLEASPNPAGAQAFAQSVRGDAEQLARLSNQVHMAQADYLDAANGMLRKSATEFGGARLALAEVEQGLDRADALRGAAATYVAGFTVFQQKLSNLAAISTWIKRERRKAEDLGEIARDAVAQLEKAIGKLGRSAKRP